jgi:hypothetical protein
MVTEVNFGGKAGSDKRYWDKRAEMWGELRDWLRRGGAIPNSPDLKTDLSEPHYGYSDDSRIKLESKDHIKARGGRSPDLGDALALTFAHRVLPKQLRENGIGRSGSKNSYSSNFNPFADMARRK